MLRRRGHLGRFGRRGRDRGRAAGIADDPEFRLDRYPRLAGKRHHFGRPGHVPGERKGGSVEHDRGEAAVDRRLADLGPFPVIEVRDDRNACPLSQRTEHRPHHGERGMPAAVRAGLQDDGLALGLGRLDEGHGVLPAENHQAGDRAALRERGPKHLGQGGHGHLNFATMSLIPGIVSTWWAWLGWKNWTSERWDSPPRMVK